MIVLFTSQHIKCTIQVYIKTSASRRTIANLTIVIYYYKYALKFRKAIILLPKISVLVNLKNLASTDRLYY